MIFAMAKEYALNLKRENHQRKQRRKARLNTMPKAILELEMPESCWQCPCIQDRTETYRWCGAVGGDCPNPPYEKRRDNCPLKPVEDKEVE